MRLPDGAEELVRLALPLPLEFAGQLAGALAEAAEGYGYTDVRITTDMASVVATPPARIVEVPEGHACAPPGTGPEVTARRWRCPVCGGRWVAAVEIVDWTEDW